MSVNPRVLEILLKYEELAEQGADAKLEDLCRDCPELLEEVRQRAAGLYRFRPPQTKVHAGEPTVSQYASSWQGSVGRYQIRRFHARGGLGEVHLADDTELKRSVAIKRISPDRQNQADARRRFLREAEITGQLEHPGVAPVYGLVKDENEQVCYAMRFIAGESLREAVVRFHAEPENVVALRRLLSHFVSVCNTMAYAHHQGVIHRDLKPANIMLGPFGETLVVDWGLARRLAPQRDTESSVQGNDLSADPTKVVATGIADARPTLAGDVLGTIAYMSPEQAQGRITVMDARSDVFSLGATLYAVLTGQAPYQGLDQVRRGEAPVPPRRIRPSTPAALEAICLKAMAAAPEDRYASASALGDDIESWLGDEPTTVFRDPFPDRLARWTRRHRGLAGGSLAAAAAITISLIAGAVFLVRSNSTEKVLRAAAVQAKTDAQNRSREKQLTFAQVTFESGELAAQRGQWADALQDFRIAENAGHPDAIELELARIQCWDALGDVKTLREHVERLGMHSDLGEHRGRVMLWQGDMKLLDGNDETAMTSIRQAIEQKLPPGDEAYARGLLAETSLEALQRFREALDHAPFHHGAMQQQGLLLMLLGRKEEMRIHAEAARKLFPDDPSFVLLLGIQDSLGGDVETAKRRLQSWSRRHDQQTLALAERIFEQMPEISGEFTNVYTGSRYGGLHLRLAANDLKRLLSLDPTLRASMRFPPTLRETYGLVFGENVLMDPTSFAAEATIVSPEMERAADGHPEGLICFLMAMKHASEQRWAEAERWYRKAAQTPAIFNEIRREALFGLLMSEAGQIVKGDESKIPSAAEHVRERTVEGPVAVTWQAITMANIASRGGDYPLASRILAEGLEREPQHQELHLVRVRVAMKSGAYARALRGADELLKTKPNDPEATKLRAEALQRLQEFYANAQSEKNQDQPQKNPQKNPPAESGD